MTLLKNIVVNHNKHTGGARGVGGLIDIDAKGVVILVVKCVKKRDENRLDSK